VPNAVTSLTGTGTGTVTVMIQVEFELIIVVRIKKDALLWGTSCSHFSSRVTTTFMLLQDYVDRLCQEPYVSFAV
jgi:hypothetical protein